MKVRANSIYRYQPVLLDQINPPYGRPQPGQLLRVKNLHGCPPANAMGHCHVVDPQTGEFVGLVCCNSLQPRLPVCERCGLTIRDNEYNSDGPRHLNACPMGRG